GPEVIETARGVEEFDSLDHALVWRTVGGKHRFLLGDCATLVDDRQDAFRLALAQALRKGDKLDFAAVEREQQMLDERLERFGAELSLAMAKRVVATMRDHPGRPILFLVDTQGQRLRHRDELLGIHRYMAHLAQCVEVARARGHRVLALVYDQALSGGFLASG